MEKPAWEATGGIHIGKSFMQSFQATWPFGRIEVFSDRILLKIQYVPGIFLKLFEKMGHLPAIMGTYKDIPDRIELNFSEINSYREIDAWFLGKGITFVHIDERAAPFLQFWFLSREQAKKMSELLEQNGVYKGRDRR